MRRHLAALVATLAVLLTAGTGAALADTPTQAAEQSAATGQSASSGATSTQSAPSNSAISVRIGSPGSGGSVSQSNSSAAGAAAGNLAAAQQQAAQDQSGAGGTQAAAQDAATYQSANADATSTQDHPSNSAISVRIGSPGDDGDVSQSNDSKAAALAGNAAETSQDVSQDPKGSSCGCASAPTQAAQQSAKTEQSANADATSKQDHPSNSAISVRIGSPGDDGDVSQSNDSKAVALAGNLASTQQSADQEQGSGSGGGTQALEQAAATRQRADSSATSEQYHPSNDATSVRIGSPGDNGSVRQSNDSAALSAAGNLAETTQDATQDPEGGSCGCGGNAVQAAGQFAFTGQSAYSDATSKQIAPSNSATSVRIGSYGDDGDVSQSNTSLAGSLAGNAAATDQYADQEQGSGGGAGVQALEQSAGSWQDAGSRATSLQFQPSNDVSGSRIASPGSGGSVDQSNTSAALSAAGNLAETTQDATQDPHAGSCGCGGDRVQAIGQFAWTGQSAYSDATSLQKGASNSVTPVGIGGHKDGCGCQSPEHGGDKDGCGCQSPEASPCGCGSGSSYGDVHQANDSVALSAAPNKAATDQSADQSQGSSSPGGCGCRPGYGSAPAPSGCGCASSGSYDVPSTGGKSSCGCSSAGVQAVGQFATTGQRADSSARSEQWWPSNSVTPVRIGSPGADGSVDQSNTSLAASLAANLGFTRQAVTQRQ